MQCTRFYPFADLHVKIEFQYLPLKRCVKLNRINCENAQFGCTITVAVVIVSSTYSVSFFSQQICTENFEWSISKCSIQMALCCVYVCNAINRLPLDCVCLFARPPHVKLHWHCVCVSMQFWSGAVRVLSVCLAPKSDLCHTNKSMYLNILLQIEMENSNVESDKSASARLRHTFSRLFFFSLFLRSTCCRSYLPLLFFSCVCVGLWNET